MTTFSVHESKVEEKSGSHMAFVILVFGYICLPIVVGIDKFFNALANWQQYLAPQVIQWSGASTSALMRAVGGIEIAAGLLMMISPKFGGYVIAAWLWCVIANLAMAGGYYDIMLRDFGLSLGAIAVAQLARDNKF